MAAKHPASSAAGNAAAGSPPSSSTALNPDHDAQSGSKRVRGAGTVTQNACTECRKKRAKCDGQNPCARCKSQGRTDCTYEAPVRQSKETLRKEVEALKRSHDTRDHVLSALVRPNLSPDVLMRLRNGQSVESISKWLSGASQAAGDTVAGALPTADNRALSSTPSCSDNLHNVRYSSGRGSYGPSVANSSIPTSPISSHPRRTFSHDDDSGSPLPRSLPLTHDYAVTATSGSQPDPLSSTADTTPQRQTVESRHEGAPANDRQRLPGSGQVLIPEIPDGKVPPGTWTKITDDSQLIQHLLGLYFCWEYPIFAPLSREHFLKAFQDGGTDHCSSILVNALLALGCRFSTQPRTRANPEDPYTSGDHFFQESLRLLHHESDHHNLTTIQALGLLSLREASCGRNSESRHYAAQSIRLAVEMGLDRNLGGVADDDEETVVELVTFWGAFTLELVWCLATGSLPQCSFSPYLAPKPTATNTVDGSLWVPYTDDGAPLNRPCAQVSNVRSVFQSFCKLSEIVHQSLYILYSPTKPLTSRALISIYNRCINWYDEIPDVLRIGVNFTPAVIFVHMYYHFAIMFLFRHFVNLRIIGSVISPIEVCLEAADAIQGLTRSYSQLYTLARTPSFTPYFVLMSSTIHLTVGASLPPLISSLSQSGAPSRPNSSGQGPPQQQHATIELDPQRTAAVTRGIQDLKEMSSCHAFAQEATSVLLHLAKKWKIDIDIEEEAQEKGLPGNDPYRPLALTFTSSGAPWVTTDTPTIFAGGVEEQSPNWLLDRTPRQPTAGLGRIDQATQALSMEEENAAIFPEMVGNLHLWPFAMRRHPMLPANDKLEEAGFELLLAGELAQK